MCMMWYMYILCRCIIKSIYNIKQVKDTVIFYCLIISQSILIKMATRACER